MPTINISRKVFEQLVGRKLPLEKLKDRISYLGTDLESVTENEIIVEVFPNRPDMLSVQGFARAFSSFIGAKKGLRKYTVEKSNEKVIIEKSVADVRPYTACAIVKNLHFDDEKIKEVILFGSVAKGTFDKKSDIDLFFNIKEKKDEKEIEEKLKSILKSFEVKSEKTWALKNIKLPISFIAGNLEDKTWKNIKEEIISSGILLYGEYKENPEG